MEPPKGRKRVRILKRKILPCLVVILAVPFIAACGGKAKPADAGVEKTPAAAEKSKGGASGPSQGEVPDADLIVEYKHTGFSYAETFGFDTYEYRFSALADGSLGSAVLYALGPQGRREKAAFAFVRAGEAVRIMESDGDGGKEHQPTLRASLVPHSGGEEVKGVFEGVLEITAQGFLSFRTPAGEMRDEYWMDGSEGSGVSRKAGGDSRPADGRFFKAADGALRHVERIAGDEAGAEDVQVIFNVDSPRELRFITEGVVPMNEVRVAGNLGILRGNLLNLAILDSVLGPDRRIRPGLARLYFRP